MKFVILAVKLAITSALVWLLVKHVNFAPIGHFLQTGRAIIALTFCVILLIAQAMLAALRIRWIMRLMGADLPLHTGFSTWMMGLLISQTLVTFIAGDAARIWQLSIRGYGRRLAGGAIFLERALGFAVLMGLVLLCVPALLTQNPSNAVRAGLMTIAALCGIGIVGFVASAFFGRVIASIAPRLHAHRIGAVVVDITSAARHLGSSWKLTAGVISLSAIMHLCNAFVFYVLGTAAGINLDMVTTAFVSLPVMLIALMPIALAGWGIREGAAVVGYGLFAVPPEAALAVSVSFGLVLLLASLPGGFYLWFSKPTPQSEADALTEHSPA